MKRSSEERNKKKNKMTYIFFFTSGLKEGTEIWVQAETAYNERVSRVENQIIARLRDRLGTAKSANEMFRVFSKFNALFVRPKVQEKFTITLHFFFFAFYMFLLFTKRIITIFKKKKTLDSWCYPRISDPTY